MSFPVALGILSTVAIAAAFDYRCVKDALDPGTVVLYLPRQTWAYIIVLATPLGGMTYLTIGRMR